MTLDDTDRRRFLLAAVLTLIALPTLWWANRADGNAGPNVATAGVDIDVVGGGTGTITPAGANALTTRRTGPAPVFLDGPSSAGRSPVADIAVPAPLDSLVMETATYSSSMWNGGCRAKGLPNGERITVVNLDNNRTVTCVVETAPVGQEADLILTRGSFTRLADLTEAPIPVEIRR